jgi:hypothetical protein
MQGEVKKQQVLKIPDAIFVDILENLNRSHVVIETADPLPQSY